MRWKSIVKTVIIIFAFFLMAIECKTDVMVAETIKLFLGDFDKEELIYNEYIIAKSYDETDEAFLTRMLKMSPKEEGTYVIGIPNDASIKKIALDAKNDLVLIHMTQGYETTYYGSLGEALMLKSLVNTVTHYYNVHKAIIQIEGKPYASGHFCFEEIEVITALE